MRLQSEGVDRCALFFAGSDEADELFAFAGMVAAVVVIDEQDVGVGGLGLLEGLYDEVFSQDVAPWVVAEVFGILVGECFVDHIPHSDLALVSSYDGVDVRLESLLKKLCGDFGFAVLEEPRGSRAGTSPDEAVAAQVDAVLFGPLDQFVGLFEIPDAFLFIHLG
ncbi:hypothetical protein N9165_01660 [Akkermansiaceae bacterium]|nr:hypothetical protein [Akkermansiaceae bacterium]